MDANQHRSVRGNYLRCFLLVFVIFPCVVWTHTMGDQCDWSGSGLSSSRSRGVTPVYLRCTEGKVRWTFPNGALRVLLRLPNSDKEFRGCIRVSKKFAGARIFLEGSRSLTPVFALGDGGHSQLIRCFPSRGGVAALYVEAASTSTIFEKQIAEFRYDLQPISQGSTMKDLINEECSPCTRQQLAHAFCTNDLVTRGQIESVDDLQDLEQARINVRVNKLLRESTATSENAEKIVSYYMPRHCEPHNGPGEFVFMGRKKLGDLMLTCAANLGEWTTLVSAMNRDGSAHCVLTHS